MTVPVPVPARLGGGGNVNSRYNRIDQSTSSTEHLSEPLSPSNSSEAEDSVSRSSSVSTLLPPDEESGGIIVVVLDTRQQKFRVGANPDWTVSEFKTYSATVHKVPVNSQRLIFMGRLLQDEKTLRDQNLTTSETIVHLFPKPNVVLATATEETVENNRCTTSTDNQDASTEMDDSGESSAHIPQIVVDPDESHHMLVTTSELFEAQHRVKLLSFLLLIICSMELLTLITIFLGPSDEGEQKPPGDPTDYSPPDDMEMRTWRTSDYFDVVLSTAGFYVSLVGLRASTENTLPGAKKYFWGLVGVGLAWLGYYYYLSVDQIRKAQGSSRDNEGEDDAANAADGSDGNVYSQALVGLLLPIIVWSICFLRAWQFRTLIMEAEREAVDRHLEQAQQLQMAAGSHDVSGSGSSGDVASHRTLRRERGEVQDGHDLRLTQSIIIV